MAVLVAEAWLAKPQRESMDFSGLPTLRISMCWGGTLFEFAMGAKTLPPHVFTP